MCLKNHSSINGYVHIAKIRKNGDCLVWLISLKLHTNLFLLYRNVFRGAAVLIATHLKMAPTDHLGNAPAASVAGTENSDEEIEIAILEEIRIAISEEAVVIRNAISEEAEEIDLFRKIATLEEIAKLVKKGIVNRHGTETDPSAVANLREIEKPLERRFRERRNLRRKHHHRLTTKVIYFSFLVKH